MGDNKENKRERDFALKFDPKLFDLLGKFEEVELEDVDMELGDLEIWIQPGAVTAPRAAVPTAVARKLKPTEIVQIDFAPPVDTYPGRIAEVKIGATKSEGGTRGKSVVIGGEKSPAYYLFENAMPHPPIISLDVFDTRIPLAKAVKMHFDEVAEDPVAWAKL
ncbi:MAG: hypothetical protein JSW29_03325, partial [Candidatus Bathyarchaeota archaeon]